MPGAQVISLDQRSVALTIHRLGNVAVSMQDASLTAARAASAVLMTAVRARAGLHDHTLRDLAKLDHPYARRHGTIQTGRLGHAADLVHVQSGRLLAAIKGRAGQVGEGAAYDVYLDESVEHVRYVVRGTRVMLPRDILGASQRDPLTRREIMRVVTLVLGKGLRSQPMLAFGEALK